MGRDDFTDEELLAYADERLAPVRATQLETLLRTSGELLDRLSELIRARDSGAMSLGEIWQRGRFSCPSRSVWLAYVAGQLSDGLSQYLQFHVNTVGCRICQANLEDLRGASVTHGADGRIRKIFQSSTGRLRHPD